MSVLEIVLLIVGAVVFVLSFMLPETSKQTEREIKLDEDAIAKAIDERMTMARGQLNDIVDETMQYALEKTERSLERISNEKMMVVGEYADSVLRDIDKNHQEVVFLYDMLSDKSVDLKNTVREAQQISREAKETMVGIEEASREATEVQEVPASAETGFEPMNMGALPNIQVPVAVDDEMAPVLELTQGFSGPIVSDNDKESEKEEQSVKKVKPRRNTAPKKRNIGIKNMPQMDIAFGGQDAPGRNKNEKILELHRQGKSNVEIARELGLGMGEVKLVIDLFKG